MALLECVVEDHGGVPTVHLRGEVDAYSADHLRACLDDVIAGGATEIVVDLAGLEYIDSAGLGVLVAALRRLRHAGGDLALRSPSTWTYRLLEISGLTQRFRVISPPGGDGAAG